MMFKRIINFFKELFRAKDSTDKPKGKEDFYFEKIMELERTPDLDTIGRKDFVFVRYNQNSYWALFKCPCDCGAVISLPLQNGHNPRWTLKVSEFGRPTLYPSIWQNKGCFSHFWITDGKVEVCGNTGIEPWKAEPSKYSNIY